MKGKTTKNDERMAFFTLEDREGEIECLAFPKIYARISHELRVDAVLCIKGTLSVKEDERPTVLVSVVTPLQDDHAPPRVMPKETVRSEEQARAAAPQITLKEPVQRPRILYLRVPSMQDPKYKKALNILEIFDGAVPVSIYDASTSSYRKLDMGFDLTEYTLRELISILGKDNVVLK